MGLEGLIEHHAYIVTALLIFCACMGALLPVSLTLLVAGAALTEVASIRSCFYPQLGRRDWRRHSALPGVRFTGWWLLAGLCRLTTNPEQCIFRSADYFYRRGPHTLLFSKFVRGSVQWQLLLPARSTCGWGGFYVSMPKGAILYTSCWILIGYLFSRFIHKIEFWISRAGHLILIFVLLLVATYAVSWLIFYLRTRIIASIERVPAAELHRRLKIDDPGRLVIIADVRSHGYYDPGMQRIKNSIRVEPHRLEEELIALRDFMAPECEVYLTALAFVRPPVFVWHMLNQQNCQTKVIDGGIRAWMKAGGPLEPVPEHEVQHLPRFD
jgi:membrane protein DedA with SNARE-associated domain